MSASVDDSKNDLEPQVFIDWQAGKVGTDAQAAVPLRLQSLNVLKYLFDNAGKPVTKAEIMRSVWADTAVTDDSLVQCITEIRKALGDNDHTIIRTLSKRGYIFTARVMSETKIGQRRPSWRYWDFGIAVVALAFIVSFVTWRGTVNGPVNLPAIAVLPFKNQGEDFKGDKFADMMTEDVIIDLSHAKDFAVIARTSSDVFKNSTQDIRTIGRNLNVKYVLVGSVESSIGHVRARAQLLDTTTSSPIWSERFEEPGDDVFAVEEQITSRIAASIGLQDGAAANSERKLIRRKPPQQWDAYDAYQAGLEASHQMNPRLVPQAEEMFNKAISIDPNFARAHLGLAWVNLLKLLYGDHDSREQVLSNMLREAKTAAQLDPDDGETHAALAQAYSILHDQTSMARETDRALALAPHNADILIITSMFLVQQGNSMGAIDNINKALKLNPNYPFWYNTSLYPTLFYAGDFARSLQFAQESAKAAPVNNDFIAMAEASLGKMKEAEADKKSLLEKDPVWSAERLLTNFGTLSGEMELARLTAGAAKAGLRVCLNNEELASLPGAVHIKICDDERAKG